MGIQFLGTGGGGGGGGGGGQFCGMAELFDPPFCIWILKVSRTQILCHSLDFNTFCMIQEYLSQNFEVSINQGVGI